MQRYVKVKNSPHVLWDSKTHMYIYTEQLEGRRYHRSTSVKGKVVLEDIQGKIWAIPKSGLGAAKSAIKKIRQGKVIKKIARPKIIHALDLTLKIQETKAPRTFIIALDGDKNLRPYFDKNWIYLDQFNDNYEQAWAEYVLYQRGRKPSRKLSHDRKHLIMTLRRARKKGWIDKDFIKSDLYLNETKQSIGRALEDWEVKALLNEAKRRENKKLVLQILLAVTMGMRKTEILTLKKSSVDWVNEELDLDPNVLKTRQARKMKIPISVEVIDLLKQRATEVKGDYLFPKVMTNKMHAPIDWGQPQEDMKCNWARLRVQANIKCRFHDLRHTAITNMVVAGIPLSTISKICGASIEILNNIYDHVNRETKDNFKELFKGRFVEKTKNASKVQAL